MEKTKKKFDWGRWLVFIILIVELIVFTALNPRFLSVSNIFSMLRQVSMIGIAAAGMAMILMSGGIDISIGPIVAFTTVMLAVFTVNLGLPTIVAFLITLICCMVFGLINGFAITRFNVPAMIATLGMEFIVKGIAYLITGGIPIYGIPEVITWIGQGYVLSVIPVPVIIMVIIFAFTYVLVEKTKIGRHIMATGGNGEAARLSGIKVKQIKIFVHVMMSVYCCIAGVVMCGRVNSGQPSVAAGFEMDVIPSTVLGGVSLAGGEGHVVNVIAGVLIMGALANGMSILGLNDYWQWVVKGIVFLIAVSYDNVMKGLAKGFGKKKVTER